MCMELLSDLKCKKEVHRKWKQVKTTGRNRRFLPDHLQEWQERRCEELQVSQSPHSLEDYEANLPGSHFQACENMLCNNLDNGREHNLSRFSDNNELGGNKWYTGEQSCHSEGCQHT